MKSLSSGRKPKEVSCFPQPAFRTQTAVGIVVLAALDCSADRAGLWQEGSALGGVLQTLGQQHFSLCRGQRASSAVAFQPALSRSPESVALKLNATNTHKAATILKIRCITCMLKPEAKWSKSILRSAWLELYLRLQSVLFCKPNGPSALPSARARNTG
jgi:hypothetical protein